MPCADLPCDRIALGLNQPHDIANFYFRFENGKVVEAKANIANAKRYLPT